MDSVLLIVPLHKMRQKVLRIWYVMKHVDMDLVI